jgi:hypothetical protein
MKGLELEEMSEIIQPEGENLPEVKSTTTVSTSGKDSTTANSPQTLTQAAAQNFGKILELAGGLVEIKKMKVASEAVLAKMEADRKQLLAEAEAYVLKKNADTNSVIERMNLIRMMMQDFYQQSNQQITGEEFKQIITSIVDQMGRMNNE